MLRCLGVVQVLRYSYRSRRIGRIVAGLNVIVDGRKEKRKKKHLSRE